MNRIKILNSIIIPALIILSALYFFSCNTLLSGLFGSDHLHEYDYNFIMFNNDSTLNCSGIFKISEIKDSLIKGTYQILDSYNSIKYKKEGALQGIVYSDKSKADLFFVALQKNDNIKISLSSTWNLLKGIWVSSSQNGKFIAFEKKTFF